jgi:hypothetical protein
MHAWHALMQAKQASPTCGFSDASRDSCTTGIVASGNISMRGMKTPAGWQTGGQAQGSGEL